MAAFDFEVVIPASREDVFDVLTDPDAMPRWLPLTEAIESVSAPLTRPGSTFRQKGAPGLRRPGRVVAADPPSSLHLELKGGGERVDLRLALAERAGGTHVRLAAEVRNAPPILGPLIDRVGGARIDRRVWRRSLDNLRRAVELGSVVARAGEVFALRGGGRVRVARVIEVDDRWVHLELLPGTWKEAPRTPADLVAEHRAPKDAFGVRPLERTFRDTLAITRRGADALLADGGFGLRHLPMTHAVFRATEPERLELDPPADGGEDRVRHWRERGGTAFGDLVEPGTGAFYSVALQGMGIDAIGFGVIKLLKTQFRGVHVRVYANVFTERPATVDGSALEMRSIDADGGDGAEVAEQPRAVPLGAEHVPLSHSTFAAWQPEFIQMALVEADELRGYAIWKKAKGSFF